MIGEVQEDPIPLTDTHVWIVWIAKDFGLSQEGGSQYAERTGSHLYIHTKGGPAHTKRGYPLVRVGEG